MLLNLLKIKFRKYLVPYQEMLALGMPYHAILDIGCGFGAILKGFSNQQKILQGYEIQEALVEKTRQHLTLNHFNDIQIDCFSGDPNEIKNLQQFDVIYLNDVLHHIPPSQQQSFLSKIYNKMKAGSRLIIKDIDAASKLVYFNKIHDLLINRQYPHEISLQACKELCTKLNFNLEKSSYTRKLWYPHYILVVSK